MACACGLVLVWLGGCSWLVRVSVGIVRGLACFGGCALPLGMLSGLIFSLVLRFRAFVGVFVRVMRLNAFTGVFLRVWAVSLCALVVMLCADALTVDEGRTLSRGRCTPCPIMHTWAYVRCYVMFPISKIHLSKVE